MGNQSTPLRGCTSEPFSFHRTLGTIVKYRLVCAALAALIVAGCAHHAQSIAAAGGTVNGSGENRAHFDTAVGWLHSVYYKPVDDLHIVAIERKALLEYLRFEKIHAPSIPEASKSTPTVVALLAQLHSADRYAHLNGPLTTDMLAQVALTGVMDAQGDPYTVYLPKRDYRGLQEMLQGGNFSGIGVYIYALKDGGVLLQPIEGMPASKAGMGPVEIVTSVNGVSVHKKPLDSVMRMIRGPVGTTVKMQTHTVEKPIHHRSYTITRQIIHVPTVLTREIGKYRYIRLVDFGSTSAHEVREALLAGVKDHAQGYILDLRNNGGGLVDAAVRISSYFIPEGTIVSTVYRNGHNEVDEATGQAISGLSPLVVLVNKYSASASEITTGALQDYKRATVIGTKTFGKGVVQQIFPFDDGSAAKITVARYLTPKGRSIQHKGLIPDIIVPQNPLVPLTAPGDKQLQSAITWLNEHQH